MRRRRWRRCGRQGEEERTTTTTLIITLSLPVAFYRAVDHAMNETVLPGEIEVRAAVVRLHRSTESDVAMDRVCLGEGEGG